MAVIVDTLCPLKAITREVGAWLLLTQFTFKDEVISIGSHNANYIWYTNTLAIPNLNYLKLLTLLYQTIPYLTLPHLPYLTIGDSLYT